MKKRIISVVISLALVLLLGGELLLSLFAVNVSAAGNIQSYDISPIESDMANMEEANYPANQFGECEVVGFMEYCYSENSAYSSVYGLYVYVYNPTEKPLIMREGANKIQMATSYKEDGTQKTVENLRLTYLDNTDNYRFYKFKITDSSSLYSVAKDYAALWNGKRRYEVTAINMMFEGSADTKTSKVSRIYEFTGYAAWCGEPSVPDSTLECQYYGGQSVHLQVYDTNYRFGHKGDNLYDDLQSVYFSLPNEYSAQWGNLSKITAEWYQYKTSPMFVTKDMEAYSALFQFRNVEIDEYGIPQDPDYDYSPLPDLPEDFIGPVLPLPEMPITYWRVLWEEEHYAIGGDGFASDYYSFSKGYNGAVREDLLDSGVYELADDYINVYRLDWLFPITKEIESIDDYRVPSEEVKQYIKDYTNAFSNQDKILDKYASNLFERYEGDGYQSNSFLVTDAINYLDKNDNQSFWEKLWGINETTEVSYSPIVTISQGDFYLSIDSFSEKYFVNKDDVEEIIDFAKESYKNNETPYLLRFAKTDYYASKARYDYAEEKKTDMSDVDGYVAQEYVFLNFDILSLEYTSADGFTKNVIGVVADSIDIINGLTAPEDIIEEKEWWQKIMAALLVIIVLIFVWPFVSPLVTILFLLLWDGVKFLIRFCIKRILWVLTLPFRIIGWFLK